MPPNRITPKRSRTDRAGGLPPGPRSVRRTTLNLHPAADGERRIPTHTGLSSASQADVVLAAIRRRPHSPA